MPVCCIQILSFLHQFYCEKITINNKICLQMFFSARSFKKIEEKKLPVDNGRQNGKDLANNPQSTKHPTVN